MRLIVLRRVSGLSLKAGSKKLVVQVENVFARHLRATKLEKMAVLDMNPRPVMPVSFES